MGGFLRGAGGGWGRDQKKIEIQWVFPFINSYGKVKNGDERKTMLGSSHFPPRSARSGVAFPPGPGAASTRPAWGLCSMSHST